MKENSTSMYREIHLMGLKYAVVNRNVNDLCYYLHLIDELKNNISSFVSSYFPFSFSCFHRVCVLFCCHTVQT
jgi:hypothetical protein